MATFTINGRRYNSKPVDFNMVCDFEDAGLSFAQIEKKTTAFIRQYVAFCGNFSVEQAGKEIEQHIINGGNLGDIASVMMEEVTKSDFFQALNKNKETEITEIPTAKSKK